MNHSYFTITNESSQSKASVSFVNSLPWISKSKVGFFLKFNLILASLSIFDTLLMVIGFCLVLCTSVTNIFTELTFDLFENIGEDPIFKPLFRASGSNWSNLF